MQSMYNLSLYLHQTVITVQCHVLVKRLGVVIKNPPPPDTLLVDASQLLYHIVWPSSGTVLTQTDIVGLDLVLGEKAATQSDLMATGTTFFPALYGQKKSASMTAAGYEIFYKRNSPPALKSLPPTDRNLAFHIQRAHLQMMLWMAADKAGPPAVQITDYGWEVHENGHVIPVLSKEPIVPGKIMGVTNCCCRAEVYCSCVANMLS
ncbi:hypothetical protein Hamer_G026018 [Homarus americanus]|uniref:Uncharacterized protein n=1 Tax=Homarus americanus TaxID=6706 RepID=A0A8J5JRI5_HOMAM|nr:hypothetical protein Hamer_G026018 [Homarus americanus]